MRIAQIAPLYESVPPKMYGGTERVVCYLTDELVKLGHQVTLFASGDSHTTANLVPSCGSALRLDKNCLDPLAHHILQMELVRERMREFDILHYHTDYLHFPFSLSQPKPTVTTLHGRLDLPDLKNIYLKFSSMPVISISNSQRFPLPMANWAKTVYHGLPEDIYSLGTGKGGYAAFIGRISPEKRVDRAIEIAIKAGIPLKIAAKVDKVDQDYFNEKIKHLLDHPLVDYIGEIGEKEKNKFLGDALCLLFPIDWPEPFGMVMIEAMACGTPVIAFNHGSVPEVLEEKKSGFIVESIEEAVKALKNLHEIDRYECRKVFEIRFSSKRMAMDYITAYKSVIEKSKLKGKPYKVAS